MASLAAGEMPWLIGRYCPCQTEGQTVNSEAILNLNLILIPRSASLRYVKYNL